MEPMITAANLQPPPSWALLQRELFDFMAAAVRFAAGRYDRPDGTPLNAQDADDAYEAHSYRGLFYALGGSDDIGELAFRQWEGITRLYDDGGEPPHGMGGHPRYEAELHAEYYKEADWFHMGEGNQSFYSLGLVDPQRPAHRERVRRFADLYLGDSPAANYDAEHRLIRSPFHGSTGPRFHAELEFVKRALDPIYYPGGRARGHAQRSNLHPLIPDLEEDWFDQVARRQEVCGLFDEVVMQGDIPDNLSCTALMTNAFLHTGEERYRQWVLDYTEAWLDRVRANDGIIPDNVGLNGGIGERRNGQWWGGWYGWNSRNSARNAFLAATIASECALLLTGDYGYLELIRSQIRLLLEMARKRDDGQLVVPTRVMPGEEWVDFQPCHLQWLGRLYHASMDPDDREMILQLREGERESDWKALDVAADRSGGNLEARFEYFEGNNPDWPVERLRVEYHFAAAMFEHMRLDRRTQEQILKDSRWPPNPLVTKGLTQVTMGSPQPVYNGGLLRGLVRYFDARQRRPGLPPDVAALVDEVAADRVGVELVNLSPTETRSLIVQAGAYGEHDFADASWREESREGLERHAGLWLGSDRSWTDQAVRVGGSHLEVQMPPSTSIRLSCGLCRFVNKPSYALPWD